MLLCKRTGIVIVNAIKQNLQKLWVVAIATIFMKIFKIYFLLQLICL